MTLFERLRGRRDVDRDLADELGAHLDARIEELVEAGVPIEDARQRARRELGNATLLAERGREVWRFANEGMDAMPRHHAEIRAA